MQPATVESRQIGEFQIAWAAKLLERLHALYGSKFLQQWEGIDKAKLAAIWAEEMAGYTGEEIAKGLAACKARPFPPTLPEFLLLCRPTLNAEAAYHEAVAGMTARSRGEKGNWSHPGVYWAAVRVTSHDLLSIGWQAIRGRWEAAFRDVMSKGQWAPVPEPALALTAPGGHSPTAAEKQNFLRMIKQITGSESGLSVEKKDPKAWAKRSVQNPHCQNQTVLAMAKRALKEQSQ